MSTRSTDLEQRIREERRAAYPREGEAEVELMTRATLSGLQSLLQSHGRVELRGFGSFRKVIRPARRYHDVVRRKIMSLPPREDLAFRPARSLKDYVCKSPE